MNLKHHKWDLNLSHVGIYHYKYIKEHVIIIDDDDNLI